LCCGVLAARFLPGTGATRKCYQRPVTSAVRACRYSERLTRDVPLPSAISVSPQRTPDHKSSGSVFMFDADTQADQPYFGIVFGYCSFRATKYAFYYLQLTIYTYQVCIKTYIKYNIISNLTNPVLILSYIYSRTRL
jgi:hypothetical protein